MTTLSEYMEQRKPRRLSDVMPKSDPGVSDPNAPRRLSDVMPKTEKEFRIKKSTRGFMGAAVIPPSQLKKPEKIEQPETPGLVQRAKDWLFEPVAPIGKGAELGSPQIPASPAEQARLKHKMTKAQTMATFERTMQDPLQAIMAGYGSDQPLGSPPAPTPAEPFTVREGIVFGQMGEMQKHWQKLMQKETPFSRAYMDAAGSTLNPVTWIPGITPDDLVAASQQASKYIAEHGSVNEKIARNLRWVSEAALIALPVARGIDKSLAIAKSLSEAKAMQMMRGLRQRKELVMAIQRPGMADDAIGKLAQKISKIDDTLKTNLQISLEKAGIPEYRELRTSTEAAMKRPGVPGRKPPEIPTAYDVAAGKAQGYANTADIKAKKLALEAPTTPELPGNVPTSQSVTVKGIANEILDPGVPFGKQAAAEMVPTATPAGAVAKTDKAVTGLAGQVVQGQAVKRQGKIRQLLNIISAPNSEIGSMGPLGKEGIRQSRQSMSVGLSRGSTIKENLKQMAKGLTKQERKTLGKVLNWLNYQENPKLRARVAKYGGQESIMAPLSDKQNQVAVWLRSQLDDMMNEYAALGGERVSGGRKFKTAGGGMIWPDSYTKNFWKEYAAVAKLPINADSPQTLAALRRNKLVQDMIAGGQAADEGQAHRILTRLGEQFGSGTISEWERVKRIVPAQYLKFSVDDVMLHTEYLENLATRLQLAADYGKNYEKAWQWRNKLAETYPHMTDSVDEWLSLWPGADQAKVPKGTLTQFGTETMPNLLSDWQTATKLGLFTTVQNYPERMKAVGDYGLFDFLRAEFLSKLPGQRSAIRASGAVRGGAGFSGLAASPNSKSLMHKLTGMKLEATGFSAIERGNNYNAAMAAKLQSIRDIATLKKGNTDFKQLLKKIFSAGGEGRQAAKARFKNASFSKQQVKDITNRGYLTARETNIIMEQGAAGKHFRADIIFNPAFWHKHPMFRAMTKFKIPWGYNQLNRHGRMVLREARHGNFRPAVGWWITSTIAGELYQIVTDPLSGRDRSDQSLVKRLAMDALQGGLLSFFSSMAYARTAGDIASSMLGGPVWTSAQSLSRTATSMQEAPQHTGQAIWRMVQAEITDVKRTAQAVDVGKAALEGRPSVTGRIKQDYQVKNILEDYQGANWEKSAYYRDLQHAIINRDKAATLKHIETLTKDYQITGRQIVQSLRSRSPINVSQKHQPRVAKELPLRELKVVQRQQQQEVNDLLWLIETLKIQQE